MIVVGISPDGQDAWGVDQVTVEDSFREELDMQLDPRKLPVIPLVVGWESVDQDGFYDDIIACNLVQIFEVHEGSSVIGRRFDTGTCWIPVQSWGKE